MDVFNGKDFTGWAGPVDQYEVKDGAIVCRPNKGGTIYTKDEYADFVARVEFKLPPGGNNGLAIRYPGQGDTAYVGMCEIQVLDDTDPQYAKLDPRQYNGSAYGMVAAHRGYLRPVGEWNFEEVTVKGSTIKVELNGTVILDTDLSKVTEYMANSPHPGKTAPRAISASPATTTRWRFATSRSRSWEADGGIHSFTPPQTPLRECIHRLLVIASGSLNSLRATLRVPLLCSCRYACGFQACHCAFNGGNREEKPVIDQPLTATYMAIAQSLDEPKSQSSSSVSNSSSQLRPGVSRRGFDRLLKVSNVVV